MTTTTTTAIPIPPRPMATGIRLTRRNVLRIVRDMEAAGFMVQPKLDGDRVLILVDGDGITVTNRYGTTYGHRLDVSGWADLPEGTRLDGEAWRGSFHPFEAVRLGGLDYARACPTTRAAVARDLCRQHGVAWLFEPPTDDWLLDHIGTTAHGFEGVVGKRIGSSWRPMKRHYHETTDWLKAKWS